MGECAVAAHEDRARHDDVEALVLDTIRVHATSLIRLARRHSLCEDDAHDAYQRALEIFLRHAPRLDAERAPSWLLTVVKHEAMAVRKGRQRELTCVEVDFDAIESRTVPSPEDCALGTDLVARSAEALQRLKPQELRVLWLRAQGNTYAEIETQTGFTRTKVNRCMYEGRQAFLTRFAGIEAGDECARWLPTLSALVDGEATPEQLLELRPHLRNCPSCKAVVRELHRANAPLKVILPMVPLALAGAQHSEPASHLFLRMYETAATWAGDRAATGILRAQVIVEAAEASAHKATAIAASAAAVAGGGTVALERHAGAPHRGPRVEQASARHAPRRAAAVHHRVVAAAVSKHAPARATTALHATSPASPAPQASPHATSPALTAVPSPATAAQAAPAQVVSAPQATPPATSARELGLE